MPKSFLVKKYTNDSHWNSSKWSKLYSAPISSSKTTITSSQAEINSAASSLLSLSNSSTGLLNCKGYSNELNSSNSSIYNLSSINSFKHQQKNRFLLPPTNKHLHLNGNSTISKSPTPILNNGSLLKTTFNKQLINDKSDDLNQQTKSNKQDANFNKLLPTNSIINRQQKTNLVKFNDSKRQPKPTSKAIKESFNDQDNSKKNEQIGIHLFFDYLLLFLMFSFYKILR